MDAETATVVDVDAEMVDEDAEMATVVDEDVATAVDEDVANVMDEDVAVEATVLDEDVEVRSWERAVDPLSRLSCLILHMPFCIHLTQRPGCWFQRARYRSISLTIKRLAYLMSVGWLEKLVGCPRLLLGWGRGMGHLSSNWQNLPFIDDNARNSYSREK